MGLNGAKIELKFILVTVKRSVTGNVDFSDTSLAKSQFLCPSGGQYGVQMTVGNDFYRD